MHPPLRIELVAHGRNLRRTTGLPGLSKLWTGNGRVMQSALVATDAALQMTTVAGIVEQR